MADFLCWFHPTAPLAPSEELTIPGDPDRIGNGGCGMAGAAVTVEQGVLGAITGHPRWREPELTALAAERGDAVALITAWRRYGNELLGHMAGAFALVLADTTNGRLMAALDRMGQEALYFLRTREGVVLANRLGLLRIHPDTPRQIDPQAIHDYLYFHMIPAPRTLYAGVEKLPAARRLVQSGRTVGLDRYWTPEFSESPVVAERLGEELQDTLGSAVERHLGPGSGSFLSGGLDSSTVTGFHARRQPDTAHAFSIGFDVPGYDEIPYARLAADHFGTPLTEYYVTPRDVADAVESLVGQYDEPFGNSSALPAYFCARVAREQGVTRMLAGDGGDELFAGNSRYARQEIFEQYFRLPRMLRGGLIEPLLQGPAGRLPGLRKGRSYVEQALVPLPDRLETYNFLHRIDPATVFEADFLAAVDPEASLRHLRDLYAVPAGSSRLNRMLYLDWQITLADNDLRKVAGATRHAGVEVVYPMLDDEVVALSCRVPSRAKLRHGRLRHFYKQAFKGFLPDAVLDKRKHGFGLPFGMWLRDDRQLHELAQDMLHKVRNSGWVRSAFIDELLDVHLRDHPGYYGEYVWVLMALGIWLDRNEA